MMNAREANSITNSIIDKMFRSQAEAPNVS